MTKRGIKILEVESGSPADAIGLAPGDQILAINDHAVSDELALQFYLAEGYVCLKIRRPEGAVASFNMELSDRSDLGIKVEEFRTQTCNNDCLFCFIDQLPAGVRPSLRLKDDDYRLSFLHGNYITLTNLSKRGLDRIIEQRLSPLYVSVHATDPVLRARMLGRKKPDDLDGKLRKLVRGGIRLHTQIVLIPHINDGKHLEKTVFDLHALYPGIQSVAIVPLGLSDHGVARNRLKPVTPSYSRRIISRAIPWQARFRSQTGRSFVYLADEFYIQGGVELPETRRYDDFGQIEDGVGMVRAFLDDFEAELKHLSRFRQPLRGTIMTGELFYPALQKSIERLNHKATLELQVLGVPNRFMGKRITVAGLLAGSDFLAELRGRKTGAFIIIPSQAVSPAEGILLDNLSPADLSRELSKPVFPGGRTVSEFFRLLHSIANP